MEFYEVIAKRRTTRRFTTEPVPRETVERILDSGRNAPSGANRQPWLFVVVAEPAAKAEIRRHAEAADKKWHARAPAWLRAFFHEQEIMPVKPFLTDAPYLVCVFGEKGNPYWRESAWIAIGHMSLAATAEGLPTLTYTPGQTGYLNHILDVAARYVPLAILPIGHPGERPDPALRTKKSLGEVARFAVGFTPYDGQDLTEPLAELSNLE